MMIELPVSPINKSLSSVLTRVGRSLPVAFMRGLKSDVITRLDLCDVIKVMPTLGLFH
jgi:hypothetical protein